MAAGFGGMPLAGKRVLEMAAIGPVPHCGLVLRELGADVLRIDRPAPSGLGIDAPPAFDALARGKGSRALDLKHPQGIADALDLVAEADVLIEGFRPGVMERLGLGPDACLARNGRLVYGRVSGWGEDGPMAQEAGHDLNYLSLTGALLAMGEPGAPPPVPLNLIGDFGGAAMQLAVGVLAALVQVQAGGAGGVVSTSILDGAHALTPFLHGLLVGGRWTEARAANLLDGGAPFYRCYAAQDGGFVAVGAIEPPFYRALLAGLGLAEAVDTAAQMDRASWADTAARFAAVFRTRARDAWAVHFAGKDACVTPVLSFSEAVRHPQNARAMMDAGGWAVPRAAPRFGL